MQDSTPSAVYEAGANGNDEALPNLNPSTAWCNSYHTRYHCIGNVKDVTFGVFKMSLEHISDHDATKTTDRRSNDCYHESFLGLIQVGAF